MGSVVRRWWGMLRALRLGALGLGVLGMPLEACPLGGPSAPAPEEAKVCEMCPSWNEAQEPFQLFANTYYIGTKGLSVLLVVTSEGLVVLDAALPQTVPLLEANIRTLGFKLEDVRWVLTSHAHFDHVGGVAALVKRTGAQVLSSKPGAQALQSGRPAKADPQRGYGAFMHFAPVKRVKGLEDGQSLSLGGVTFTLHHTPGHTPGGASWSWRSCEGDRCYNMVYVDSLNPVAAPGFRYGDPSQNPNTAAQLQKSIEKVSALPCDVVVAAHPGFSETFEKLERRKAGMLDAFITPDGCKSYASDAAQRLADRLEQEKNGAE
ncbi:MAG: subclass B3 metallo-beta-lactamase [Myxococcota bacterium]